MLPANKVSVTQQTQQIKINGARAHNLKDISVNIPRNRLVVITGPSGSGKSSLAFDTLFAEGQRQYIESLSVYSRQFFHQMERADVDLVEGLQPTISIDQKSGITNPRSTVGTVTEIYDYMRLLYARLGIASCPKCGKLIRPQSPDQILESLLGLGEGARMMMLSPIIRGRKGEHKAVLEAIRKAGYLRARIDGRILELEPLPELDRAQSHTVEAVVDRIVIRKESRERILESIHLALRHGNGRLIATCEQHRPTGTVWVDRLFSTKNTCPECGKSFESLEPRMFSFNSSYGVCTTCEGFGYLEKFDPDLIIPSRAQSLATGAVAVWANMSDIQIKKYRARLAPCLAALGIRWNTPLEKLSNTQFEYLLYGSESDGATGVLRGAFSALEAAAASLAAETDVEGGDVSCAQSSDLDSAESIFSNPTAAEADSSSIFTTSASSDLDKLDISSGGSSISLGEELSDSVVSSLTNITAGLSGLSGLSGSFISSLSGTGSRVGIMRRLPREGDRVEGIVDILREEYKGKGNASYRTMLDNLRGRVTCPTCNGARIKEHARNVRIGRTPTTPGNQVGVKGPLTDAHFAEKSFSPGKTIHEVTAMTILEAREFFQDLTFDADEQWPIAEPIISQILLRLNFLHQVGLGYLTLNRSTDTLSGGEFQRVRLATGLGSGLVGVCYVLDEPSIGLHPRDTQNLIDTLRQLQCMDNTVLVVEHDENIMRQADWIIDMGPGAGMHGGNIVAEGTPEQIQNNPRSLTGKYLRNRDMTDISGKRRRTAKTKMLTLENVTTNNLKNITVDFPLGTFICLTGVSGSGKSSLLNETLAPALMRKLGGSGRKPGPFSALRGIQRVDKVIIADQSPIGRTPRSNPATYIGVFDEIRKVFTNTREARQRAYKAGRFSFNVKGGRCEHCQGQGVQKIEMNFLPDMYVTCPVCEGKRFNPQTLEVRYKDKSIADVLNMPIEEAAVFFENIPQILRPLNSLKSVGLGYISLGQPSTTLSGGEAQRLKLAAELGRVGTGNTVYILDEPTTGLHFEDVQLLLRVLNELVDMGNTVIVIEHNMNVIKSADWVIDLGPEGGADGGYVVAVGTPEQVSRVENSKTGVYLRDALKK